MEDNSPGAILKKFYNDNDLGSDGGLNSMSVKIKLFKNFCFYFPNFDARRRAVIKHDIHHLVTGYAASSISGESEISAWEIASGCKKYWPAFLIDTSGVMIGLPINFIGILKAFSRGRKTRNLYHDILSNEEALGMKISELQKLLYLDKQDINFKPSLADLILFSGFILYGVAYSIVSFVFLPFIILYSVYISFGIKKYRRPA